MVTLSYKIDLREYHIIINFKREFMKRKLSMILAALFLFVGMAWSQTRSVSGTVTSSEDGQPVVGATVKVKGTAIAAASDINGRFTLGGVPTSAKTLQVTYVGMKPAEVSIAGNVKITLHPDADMLDEVVVTGYGNFKKSTFTGSAANVDLSKLSDVPAVSAADKLAGTVSGVTVTQYSGQPGAVNAIRIRGMGSINAGNEPLYVIDGVPLQNGDKSEFTYADGGSSMLSMLNANDIESITVIKDAAAASLYGSRAANGVIVITTKQGAAGKAKVNLKADWGFANMAVDYRPVWGGPERRAIQYEGYKNYMLNQGKTMEEAVAFADSRIDSYAKEPWSGWTNWKDLLFRNGSHSNYEANVSGGNTATRYYASLAHSKQEGITANSGFERTTARLNLNSKAGKVDLGASALFAATHQNSVGEGTSYSSPIMSAAFTLSPSMYPYNQDGSFSTNFPTTNNTNPLQTYAVNYDRTNATRFLGSLTADWNIWDKLHFKEVLSYDVLNNKEDVWWDPASGDGRTSNGVMQRVINEFNQLNTQSQLFYKNTFGQHTLDALLGFETEDRAYAYNYIHGSNYPAAHQEFVNAGETSGESLKYGARLVSYLGRLNYDYQNKYYFGASFRRDGSSKLSEKTRWGNFWSLSASWRLTEESFMKNITAITDAKLRASYGVNGTQPSDYYGYMGVYKYGYKYNGISGSTETALANDDLSWEKNYATNIGLDLTLWQRLSLSFEWYNRTTKDLIMSKPISAVIGVIDGDGNANILTNIGSMRNRGWELEVKSVNFQKPDFSWTTSFNIGHNSNTLLKLNDGQNEIVGTYTIRRVGEPYYSFYGYEYAGVDKATGKESYYINKGDNPRATTTKPTEAQKVIIGSADPTVTGGLTNVINWKFIDFSFTLTYSFGGHAYDAASWLQTNGGNFNYLGNIPTYYKLSELWSKDNPNGTLPQFVYRGTNQRSSRWLLSTNHVRVKNVTLGFTLPKLYTTKVGLDRVRAYVSAANLLTFKSDKTYIDPEVDPTGIALFSTPALRTVTFGLEIGF